MSAVATTERKNTQVSLRSTLESPNFKMAIGKVLPKHLTPERMTRIAISALTRTPNLALCDEPTFLRCMMDLSQWGLEPDGRRAHLVPRKKYGGGYECTLVIDYKGYVELVYRTGLVSLIHCETVCENDVFEYDKGELKHHKIDYKKPRGEAYAAYALVRFKDGSEKCEVMSLEEINEVRDDTPAWQSFKDGKIKSTPWQSDWKEMAKKTVFRRAQKWLPMSAEIRDAIENDAELMDAEHMVQALQTKNANAAGDDLTDQMIQGASSGQDESAESSGGEIAADPTPAELKEMDDSKACTRIFLEFVEAIDRLEQMREVQESAGRVRNLIATSEWSSERKGSAIEQINQAVKIRCERIRESRGERSNEPQEQRTLPQT